jgi:hypothetical protein
MTSLSTEVAQLKHAVQELQDLFAKELEAKRVTKKADEKPSGVVVPVKPVHRELPPRFSTRMNVTQAYRPNPSIVGPPKPTIYPIITSGSATDQAPKSEVNRVKSLPVVNEDHDYFMVNKKPEIKEEKKEIKR